MHIYQRLSRGTLALLLMMVCVAFAVGYYMYPPASFPQTGVIFSITPGQSLQSVGRSLQKDGYIRSHALFSTLVSYFGGERSLSPGDYYFEHPLSVISIARQIARGDHQLVPIKVTIPEGSTVRDITAILSNKLPDFPSEEFQKEAINFEGYLFPETYFFYPKTDIHSILTQMRTLFDTQTAQVLSEESLQGKSKQDVIVMASIIEREAHGDDDRAIISAILWKRLENHMLLQVDATVAYANGIAEAKLTKADFAVDSPYNTYKVKGLPPGPISNPGIASLEAAAHPSQTDYLYYIHDKKGQIHFSKTYTEHQKNIKKYLR